MISRTIILFAVFALLFIALHQTTREHFTNKEKSGYIPQDKLYVVMGHQIPIEPQPPGPLEGQEDMPNVGGGNKNMFAFAYNKVSPECCETSPYSTDRGCICIPEDQRKILSGQE